MRGRLSSGASATAPCLVEDQRVRLSPTTNNSGQIRGPYLHLGCERPRWHHPQAGRSRVAGRIRRMRTPEAAGASWRKARPSEGYDLHLAIARPPSAHFLVSHKRKKFISEVYIRLFSQMQAHTLYSASHASVQNLSGLASMTLSRQRPGVESPVRMASRFCSSRE